jgi:DNA-binding PadR family transcriptional regulator
MKRKPGTLLPIEVSILHAGIQLLMRGTPDFHGYGVAKEIQEAETARQLTAHGTLYRALDRMEEAGLVKSRWEDPTPEAEGRPRRRLYQVTAEGERAFQSVPGAVATRPEALEHGLATS